MDDEPANLNTLKDEKRDVGFAEVDVDAIHASWARGPSTEARTRTRARARARALARFNRATQLPA